MLDTRITCWEYESGAAIKRLPGDLLRIQGPDENIIRAQSLISMETVSPLWDGREQRCTSSDGDISLQNGAIWRNDSSTRTNTASPGADIGNLSNSSNSPRDFSDSVNSPRTTTFFGSRSSPRLDSSHSAGTDIVDGRRGFSTPQQGHQGTASVSLLPSSASSSTLIGRGASPAQQDRLQERAVPSLSSSSSAPSLSTSTSSPSVSSSIPGKQEEIIALMQKLGYSRQMVEQAILQIGEHASSNEVLQMLVSQGSIGMEQEDTAGSANRDGSGSRTSSAKDASDGVEDAEDKDADPYRAVIIDGSNVAMSFGNKNVFACKGIDTVVMWFLKRGHKVIYVFVPSWRKEQSKPETPIQDQEVLIELEKARILVWTPSRRVKGRRMVCYDDRYILNLAIELDGIIVSNDTFRDLCAEKPEYQKVVEERLLMYSFAGEKFMPPDDPLGRNGPNLDNFLRKTPSKPAHQMQPCPYGKKCTYGNKCKYGHPERSRNQRPTSEILLEKDRERKERRIISELHARALNRPDPIQMRLEREVAEEDGQAGVIPGRGGTDPLGYPTPNPSPRGADRNAFPGHTQKPPHPDSAATFPLMTPSRPETNLTAPLSQQQMASIQQLQRLENVPRGGNGVVYRVRDGSALPVARGLASHNYHQQPFLDSRHPDGHPDQRVMSGFHHPPGQPAIRPVHSVQRRGQQQRSQQQLPERTSLTAPISGYTPMHHQALQEQHLTAPLIGPQESLQYHNSGHARNRHSMPPNHRDAFAPGPQHSSNFARDGNPALPQFGTEGNTSSHFARNVSAAGDLLHDFGQMSLREPSRSSLFEEERHHTFPLTNPHRSSPGPGRHTSEFSQSSMSLATDDEGYFSPRYPIEQTVASPVPGQQTVSQGYPLHQGSDTRHPQSHPYQFSYPNASSNLNHAPPAPQSRWSQPQSMQGSKEVAPPMGRMEPQLGRLEPQLGRQEPQAGRLEPQVGRMEPHAGRAEPPVGHWGMHQSHGQQAMTPPQHGGEPPMVPRAGWPENDNRARIPQDYMRNPQNQL